MLRRLAPRRLVLPPRTAVASAVALALVAGTIGFEVASAGSEPSIRGGSAAVPEGHAGSSVAEVEVWLDVASAATVTVEYRTQPGTASDPSDYASVAGTLTFPPGRVRATIAIDVRGDTTPEDDETVRVVLSNPSEGRIESNGSLTIVSDDEPALLVRDATVLESGPGSPFTTLTMTIAISPAASVPVVARYETLDGTAVAPGDYLPAQGGRAFLPAVEFVPGQRTASVDVRVVDDPLPEGSETLALRIAAATTPVVDAEGVATILDNDAGALPTLWAAAWPSTNEGYPLQFSVVLGSSSATPVTVSYATALGSPGTDFLPAAGTVTWLPGESGPRTVAVQTLDDLQCEGNETVTLTFGEPALGNARWSGSRWVEGQISFSDC